MVILCGVFVPCGAQQNLPPERVQSPPQPVAAIQALIDQSVLTSKGKKPFLLGIHFQIFDMKGVLSDEGTLTYWWGEAAGEATRVTSKTLGTRDSLVLRAEQPVEVRRELALLDGLLGAYIFPGGSLQQVVGEPEFTHVRLGQADLRCLNPTKGKKFADPYAKVCVDIQDNIRDVFSSDRETLYNHPAMFAGTRVALDVDQAINTIESVSGHVEQLHSIEPSKVEIPLTPVGAASSRDRPVSVPRRVIAGQRISGEDPGYPIAAKQLHVGGEVLLLCTVSSEGRVALITPLASPNPILTQAAVDAVQNWKFSPWIVNGRAVNVSTHIAVRFYAGPH